MKFEESLQSGFVVEMMETMASATEIFNRVLLQNLDKYFGLKKTFITVFDFDGNFLSLTDPNRLYLGEEHPYSQISGKDICAQKINEECRRAQMWHDNVKPYIYRSTDLLSRNEAETSEYVRFLNTVMRAKYMVIMPFDIYGCIHLCVYRGEGEMNFSDQELQNFEKVYEYIARTFKSFKKLEKPKIISNIKDEVILTKEDAYIVTDINHKILSANQKAIEYLSAMTGKRLDSEHLQEEEAFLRFLLQGAKDPDQITTTVLNGYTFQVHPFPMNYVHGMVELYHWITIGKSDDLPDKNTLFVPQPLTKREQKVAELLCQGLSYQAIGEELFISFHTVKNHVQNIFSKYGVNSRYQFHQVYQSNQGR